ncbi:hypothetical protein MBLNU230_g3333t1 [Neophaeotheca triangularis]
MTHPSRAGKTARNGPGTFHYSRIWNSEVHQRRMRLVAYQLAIAFSVASGALGIAVVIAGRPGSKDILHDPNSLEMIHYRDYIVMATINALTGLFIGIVYGSATILELCHPWRKATRYVRMA